MLSTKDLLQQIVQAMVDYPERVEIAEISSEGAETKILEVVTHPSDIGKVIGRQGSNAIALRTILKAIGGARQERYWLEIEEGRGHGH
jgi:predicted RNA-binding protein YlqC (UPF0109 family)